MASKAFQNVICILATCEGVGNILEKNYRNRPNNKTMLGMIPKLYQACHEAHALWTGELDVRTLRKIEDRLGKFETRSIPQNGDPIILTSLALGLLSDLMELIRDAERLFALDEVHRAMLRIHRYLDKRGCRWEAYAAASSALGAWGEVFSA